MSIELHCPNCRKLIRAPDKAGGRQGKCPYCKKDVYVPLPPDESEEIGLAPIDSADDRHDEEMRRETARYTALVDHDTGSASDAGKTKRSPGTKTPPAQAPGEVVDISAEIESFILAMRDSELDRAEKATKRLKRAGQRARDQVEGLMLDEMPPQIENVPKPVVQGFLKTLLSRLS